MPIFCPIPEYVSAAMDAAAPRPIEEVILERFPEAVIDRNNRPHAPHDGYVDPILGKVYRGGEYLPFEPNDDVIGAVMRSGRRPNVTIFDGEKIQVFEGTKGQCNAGRIAAREVMREFDCLNQFVGEVKKRDTFTVRLMNVFVDTAGYYGTQYIHFFRDLYFNSIIWKGSSPLFKNKDGGIERYYEIPPFEINATVKSHWKSKTDDRSATYLTRVSLVNK